MDNHVGPQPRACVWQSAPNAAGLAVSVQIPLRFRGARGPKAQGTRGAFQREPKGNRDLMLLLALLPAVIAVAIFAATCTMQSPKARTTDRLKKALLSNDDTPPPPNPNFGSIA